MTETQQLSALDALKAIYNEGTYSGYGGDVEKISDEGIYYFCDELGGKIDLDPVTCEIHSITKCEMEYDGVGAFVISSEGGSEGEGEHVERIFAVVNMTQRKVMGYVKVGGYYASYDGTTWDEECDWSQVTPKAYTAYNWS